jgi:hypothetical protein
MTARHPDWTPPEPKERRQLWARDTRRPLESPLVYLRTGEAEALRLDCREGRLVCPIPDCAAPKITTRAGSRRDHFAHLSGGGHGPETLHHYTAKALVGAWLRKRHPEAAVTIDLRTVESGRQPDVLVEFDDGRRFAFEIQYAGLTQAEWAKRHRDYGRDGIIDIWLFGHTRFLRAARTDVFDHPEGRFTLGPLLETVDHAAAGLLWIDPDEQKLFIRRRYSGAGHDSWSKHGIRPTVEVAAVDLALCRLEEWRLWTPIEPDELEGKRIYDERMRKARRQEAEDRRRYREDQEREREVRQHARAMRAAQQTSWERYRAKIVAAYGAIPPILLRDHRTARGMLLEPAHWHGLLVGSFINRRVGRLFTTDEVVEFFDSRRLFDPGFDHEAVVEDYLYVLRRHGFIDFAARGPFLEGPALVLADCARPSTEEEASQLRIAIRDRSEDQELAYAADLKARFAAQRLADAPGPGAALAGDFGHGA